MENTIYINFIDINNEVFFPIQNDKISIVISHPNDLILYQYDFDILYNINKTINKKQYYINTEKIINNNLVKSNFIIHLPKYYNYKYDYYHSADTNKSIIIYKYFNYIPLIYLGLPNTKSPDFFQINYNYKQLGNISQSDNLSINNCDCDCSGNYDGTNTYGITLFNNYYGNYYNTLNTLKLQGEIYKICINNIDGIVGYNNLNEKSNYKLFKIKNNMNINTNTNIYFYNDSSNLLSYIIYLNTYNFSQIKNIPTEYENIIICINYISNETGISVFNSILSLNMQTFNPDKLCQIPDDSSGNYYYNTLFYFFQDNDYYNTLFFYNYINSNYTVDSIKIFSYDNEKYFSSTQIPPELHNINYYQYDLYEYIISTDTNLSNPIILNLYNPYLFMNFDLINLSPQLIQLEYNNKYFYKLTKSNKINLDILVNYLINFIIKKYNIFKLINKSVETNPNQTSTSTNNKINPIETINFNNNIVNCINCRIIFYYTSNTNIQLNGYYSLDAKLFLNNYNLELYNKKYDFENLSTDEQKKNY